MRALDKKLARDLRRLWPQSLAVASVMAAGIATLLIGLGAYYSLFETRRIYYERANFADMFASATRAPKQLLGRIAKIDGVAKVEGRITQTAIVDVEDFAMPATGVFISLPPNTDNQLNQLTFKTGRMPEPGSTRDVAITEGFAKAHGFTVGSEFRAVLRGFRRSFRIAGIALSPEYIYAIGPGDMMPDDRRFAVIWIREPALAAATNMEGAFNSVILKLASGANHLAVGDQLDRILERYGGTKAYTRETQVSHSFLDSELKQLWAMSRVLPPVFLVVTAFLVNMVFSRLIALEREQIGLLKALGYASGEVALHYLKLVVLISVGGVAIGFAAGTWLNMLLTRLYSQFFHFPFEIHVYSGWLYAAAATIAMTSAFAGATNSIIESADVSPAVAMSPPAPPRYKRILPNWKFISQLLSQLTIMTLRNILRWPLRATITTCGIALSVSLLVSSLFSIGSVNFMIDAVFERTDRQDVSISLGDNKSELAVSEARRLPGVLAVEPFRAMAVEFSNGNRKKRTLILGKPEFTDVSRILDSSMKQVSVPSTGLLISEALAKSLGLRVGDTVQVEFLGATRKSSKLPVTGIVQTYIGLLAVMRLDALNRELGEGPRISGFHLLLDQANVDAFLRRVKETPSLAALSLQRVSLARFRETIAQNINYQISVFLSLAIIIAFGVVYNSARIQFSERARELASLRVFGFTNTEVSGVLLLEYALLTIVAVPLGWAGGYVLARILVRGFESDLYRIPFVIERSAYAYAALIAIIAVTFSALIVIRRVRKLDLVRVLKTRD